MARAIERDTAWVGDAEEVRRRYAEHWIPLHELYESLTRGAEPPTLSSTTRSPSNPMSSVRVGRSAKVPPNETLSTLTASPSTSPEVDSRLQRSWIC